MSPLPPVLAGCTVLVTAQRRADELGGALVRRGAEVVNAPTLGVVPQTDEQALVARTRELIRRPVDIVVVTTGIGFRGWVDTAEAAGLGTDLVKTLADVRLVARGPKARGALQAAGLHADWVAESETSAEIIDLLTTEGVAGQHIAVQHHGAGDDGLQERLVRAGATVMPLVVYRWGPPPDPTAVSESVAATAAAAFDAVVFTSAPGAAAWWEAVTAADCAERVRSLEATGRLSTFAVGPVTAGPLIEAGLTPLVPERGRMGALVRAVIMHLGDERTAIATPAGDLRVRARSVTLDHRVLPVSPSGAAILRRLVDEAGGVVSRQELLRVLPGDSDDPHTAEVAVARLREALGDRRLVRTVVKRGYSLELST